MVTTESHAFATLLRRSRLAKGLTQEELAERAGLSVRGISDLERGVNRTPYQATIARLIAALDLSTEEGAALEGTIRRRRGPVALEFHGVKLPIPPTALLGRERDVESVIHLLGWEGRRLVTLTGPGGVGKTRLALQVAATMAPNFADGAVFVQLAAITDPLMVFPLLSTTLGVREQAGQSSGGNLATYLEDREILLLLDNFEQVVRVAPVLAELLASCPRVKALVTSRVPLHLAGEQAMEVGSLPVPPLDGTYSPQDVRDYPSVALFLERARSIEPEFIITPDNSAAIVEICRRVDGLPLAIELAAARLKVLSPRALLNRLDHRLRVLTGGARDMAERQQTMRNTIAWSYGLLDSNEQSVFRRLSVFSGGCSLEAAEMVCAGEDVQIDVFEILTSLVDKSLLLVRHEGTDDPRFHMLETIREFAREQLDAGGEAESGPLRHAQHFLTLAEQAEPELRGKDQAIWLTRLDREHDNLRAALRWSRDSGEIDSGLRLAGALWWFWYTHGYLSEGQRWLEQLLALDTARNQSIGRLPRAKALRGAGVLATEQGDYARATMLTEESLELFRQLGDLHAEATVLNILANIAKFQPNYVRATTLYRDALTVFRQLGDRRSISVILNNLGTLAKEQGNYREALALYEESLAMKRDLGDKRGIAIVLSNIGTMAHAQGDYQRAVAAGKESVAVLRDLGDKDLAAALDTLARAVLARGDYSQAVSLYSEGLTVSHGAGEKQIVAFCLEGLGRAAGMRGDNDRSARLLGAGSALREAINAPLSPAEQAIDVEYLDTARHIMGESSFARAWNEGTAMTVEDAVAYALP